MRRAVVLVVFALPALCAAADLQCRAEVDRGRAARGEHVLLTVHAESPGAHQPRHDPPVIAGVEVIAGGTSQSFRLEGGSSQIAVTTTYYLRIDRDDSFQIPPIEVRAGTERCATRPLAIRVDPAAAGPVPPQPALPSPVGRAGAAAATLAGQPGEPVFITVQVDRDTVWVGEQIVLSFRYHRLRNAWGQPSYTPPRTEGFWRVDLPPERNFRLNAAGQTYEVTEIRYALFPTRAGTLQIDEARLSLAGDPFERFFGRRSGGPRQLATAPLAVTVRPLPVPAPPGFSGVAARRLEFTADLDRTSVPRGEPVTLALRVAADAFLKGYGGLAVPEPDGVRVFDAAERWQEDASGPRYAAVYVQEKALVPLREGRLALPPLDLVYFDVAAGRYRTASATVPALQVTPSDLPVAGDDPSGLRRTEIARLGRDLAFVHAARGRLRGEAPPLIQRTTWWLVLLAPWGLLVGYRWRLGRLAAARRDPAGMRQRWAWPRARRQLRRLQRQGGDAGELARAVVGYAADRFGRPPAGLGGAEIGAWCEELGATETGRRLVAVLAACDRTRFGREAAPDIATLARQAEVLLAALDRTRGAKARDGQAGGGRRLFAPWLALAAAALLAPGQVAAIDAAADGEPATDPARLLAEGNQAYTAGDYTIAFERYVAAQRAGIDDAVLHYNLGNVHVRRGELGRAIASYLRAQRLQPRDRDVRANLAWARANTRDLELVGGGLPPVLAELDAAVHLLSLDEWAALLGALSWLTVLVVVASWRRRRLSGGWRRARLFAGALCLAAAVIVGTRWYEEIHRDLAVVVLEQIEVRSGPAESFPVVFRVHDGLALEVRGERDGWARIGLGGDWVGWVPADGLEPVRRR